jgi:hypothetical protein
MPCDGEHIHLFKERRQIQHHTVADDARLTAHNAAGNEVQNVFDAFDHNCVTGIAPP